jgi:glycosyltransferase involved in cell wall biosynthesis
MTRPSELKPARDENTCVGDLAPFVSIIIPTYNRAKTLEKTIESLLLQTYPSQRYEIVVVDNNSKDLTRKVVEKFMDNTLVEVSYILERRQGVHYARNVALKRARGEILYYTDDDMIADADLLTQVVRPFALDAKVGTVTGRVLPLWETPPPDWVLRFCNNGLLSLHHGPEDLIISGNDCGVYSCHQALRRDAFIAAGGYNPENTAGEWIGDGETGMNIKLKDLGYRFAYIGTAITHHVIPAERMTQAYLNRRLGNQGNCDSYTDYRRYRFNRINLICVTLNEFARSILHMGMFLVKLSVGKKSWRMELAYAQYFRKRMVYDFRLLIDKSWRNLVLKDNWLVDA